MNDLLKKYRSIKDRDERARVILADMQAVLENKPEPALAVSCPVCGAPAGSYCIRGHGRVQKNTHKPRRELAAVKGHG